MKKEESFDQRDKLHSFVREHKPIPSFASSTSRKRKNLTIDVNKRKSICVSAELNANAKQFLKKRRRTRHDDDDSDYIPSNLESKRRRFIPQNFDTDPVSSELKNNEELDAEKKEALNKAFFWRFRKFFDKRYFAKEMNSSRRKPHARRTIQAQSPDTEITKQSSKSDENIAKTNNKNIEAVSGLNLNSNRVATSDHFNTKNNLDERKCACNSKPCTLKARLLASTTSPSVSGVNKSKPEIMDNRNIQRVNALESEVILCLANLKNFVNSEAAQLNDTISKIPLRSIVDTNNQEPQINPPYNINIVEPNAQATPNILYKYMRNKEELRKNIKIFLDQNQKQFNELVQQRNVCVSELQHAERTKDYFKVEWIKTRLQYLNHLMEKLKSECKHETSEINNFTFEQYLNTLERYKHRQIPSISGAALTETEKIEKEFHLRREQLKFFSNDTLVEGNRVLEYPFGGIITNTRQQNPRDKIEISNKGMPPIPPYLMQNHTIVRPNNCDNILYKPYEAAFNQQHSRNSSIPVCPSAAPNNQTIFNPNMNSVIQASQNRYSTVPNQIPITNDKPKTNQQKGRSSIISCTPKKPNIIVAEPQLSVQGNPLRPKPALIPVGVIRKLVNKVVTIPGSPNEENTSEEIPNKRIKLDNNVEAPKNIPEESNKEINANNKTKDSKGRIEEENKRKKHLRLQFSLISNKTITLSYLLKMMNQNLNSNSFANFILKPKNIEELCNIIRKREIFAKIEENSSCQYPNVLTIMNHFLIYVIVCVQIENKINYKELYLKVIRDKNPIRYDYYHAPDPISLENIDMCLQKAALELHEAIILNSTENNMKNSKCICSKIKPFTGSKPQQEPEEYANYFIKAHGETEISIIVLYEPKFKNITKMAKKFTQKCRNDVPPANIHKEADIKQKTSSENMDNVQVVNNFTTFTSLNTNLIKNTDIVPRKTTNDSQFMNFDTNKNMTFNFDVSQLAKSFETWEKLLENPENQRIVSEIFENKSHEDKPTKNASSPDLDKTFDNIWNDMENSNELITMSEEELEKEIDDLLDEDVNVNNIIRKRRISLPEPCFKNNEEIKIKNTQDQSKIQTIKRNNENNSKVPDFVEINKYKVINVDEKSNVIPPVYETINDESTNTKILKRKEDKNEHKVTKTPNKDAPKIIEIRSVVESTLEISKKYYDDPKFKINTNKNDIFQKTPLDLSHPYMRANNKQSKTENKTQSNQTNNCKRSKFEKNFLDNAFLGKKSNFLDQKNTKFCINFNTLVYINEIDYQIILEILNEAAKPLYTFYKFVNTTRCNNNQPLINFTAFFFGLKFKKLQKYKKMYEELHRK